MPIDKKIRPARDDTPPPALRLRILWQRGQWWLVKVIHLPSKVLPAADLPISGKGALPLYGVWFDALDTQERILLRRRVIEPLPMRAEIAIIDPDEFLLDLLMPDAPEIARVRLLANPDPFQPGLKAVGDAPSLLAEFDIPRAPSGKGTDEAIA